MSKAICENCQKEFSVSLALDAPRAPRCPVCDKVPDEYLRLKKRNEDDRKAAEACESIKGQLEEVIANIESAQNQVPGVTAELLVNTNQALNRIHQRSAVAVEGLSDISQPTSSETGEDGSKED